MTTKPKIYIAGHEAWSVRPVLKTNDTKLKTNDIIIRIDPRYFRPTEVKTLLGDPSKAKEKCVGFCDCLNKEYLHVKIFSSFLKICFIK